MDKTVLNQEYDVEADLNFTPHYRVGYFFALTKMLTKLLIFSVIIVFPNCVTLSIIHESP